MFQFIVLYTLCGLVWAVAVWNSFAVSFLYVSVYTIIYTVWFSYSCFCVELLPSFSHMFQFIVLYTLCGLVWAASVCNSFPVSFSYVSVYSIIYTVRFSLGCCCVELLPCQFHTCFSLYYYIHCAV